MNNGGVSPSPRVVHEAYKRYLDVSNQSPVYHMWQVLEPNREAVRRKLAASAGCDPEELAITRNASEALQIAQLGLDLAPGDEVLTTNQDYGRMLDTWEQRVQAQRDRAEEDRVPRPAAVAWTIWRGRFEAAITPRTKVIHVCHITNLTGQIFPVQRDLPAWRAPAASAPSSTARTPTATSRSRCATWSATTTAPACTSGCSRRSAPASSTCAGRRSRTCGR